MTPRLCVLFGCALLPTLLRAAVAASSPPKPAIVVVQPEVLAYAKAHAIPTDAIELAADDSDGREGDAITALVALRERKATRQWLTCFVFAAATAKEQSGYSSSWSVTVNAHEHKFTSGAPVALHIRTIGPFVAGSRPPAEEKSARTLISPTFLGLGLDRACAAMLSATAGNKVKPGETAANVALAYADEHVVAGLLPALAAFFQGVQDTPGLSAILMDVIDKPSVWSVVKHAGKIEAGFNLDVPFVADPAAWGLTGVPCYGLPLAIKVYDQPALRCTFFVTSPRPPLLTTGGIVGIAAESPTDPARRIDIRVLAAKRAR